MEIRIKKCFVIFRYLLKNCEIRFNLISNDSQFVRFVALIAKNFSKKGLFANPLAKVIRNRPKLIRSDPEMLKFS